IHENDVCHRDESSGPGENLGPPIGAERLEFEVALEPLPRRQAPAPFRRASINDFTHIPTYTNRRSAIMDCATTALGRATSPPASIVKSFSTPATVPRK